jgi:hypothetical protein
MSDTPKDTAAAYVRIGLKPPLNPHGFTDRVQLEQAMSRMKIGVATPADFEKLNNTSSAQMNRVILGT